ncbi:MAG: bifunctional adenosylcobinamide kinase/adenosylcobinamide-phosphate guanylyltransferase [Dehalococcoidia bacterium]|nr:bifunctional adenosylcobinamide kinase/adenosylcobinamide-phosphate guanylyltransferase [Dehalococcoidia bacterium]
MGAIFFVTGGARSGKSTFAEHLAARAHDAAEGGSPVVYLATMQAGDDELRDRIARHQSRRPEGWTTVEEPLALAQALAATPPDACVLIDCLSLWVTNRLMQLGTEDPPLAEVAALEAALDSEVDALLAIARGREGTTITVTNEVGAGLVPPYPLGRVYRDVLGRVNQRVSRGANLAWLLVSGRALELPPPVE